MIKRYLVTTLAILFTIMAILPVGTEAVQLNETEAYAEDVSDNARGTTYKWFYKDVNGQRYMRLYNATDGVWVTDWIPVES